MIKIKPKNIIIFVVRKLAWFLRRSVVFYLFIFMVFTLTIDYDKMFTKTLNYLMPDFEYISEVAKDPEKLKPEKLEKYIRYYEKVAHYTPENASALFLLGFCYYNTGEQEKALYLFKRAAQLHPMFFWYHYNLGVAYFNKEKYSDSAESFMKAVNSKWDVTLAYMHSSFTYQRIISRDIKYYSYALTRNLNKAYYKACALTVISYFRIKEFPAVLRNATYAIDKNLGGKRIFYYYGGLAAYELKLYPKSINLLQQYLRLSRNESSSDAFLYLGLSLEAIGQKDKADVFINKAENEKGKKDPIISSAGKATVQIF